MQDIGREILEKFQDILELVVDTKGQQQAVLGQEQRSTW